MIFNAEELEFKGQEVSLSLSEENKLYASNFVKENNITEDKIIGIHMGSSPRWPSKAWSEEKIKEFITKCKEKG